MKFLTRISLKFSILVWIEKIMMDDEEIMLVNNEHVKSFKRIIKMVTNVNKSYLHLSTNYLYIIGTEIFYFIRILRRYHIGHT